MRWVGTFMKTSFIFLKSLLSVDLRWTLNKTRYISLFYSTFFPFIKKHATFEYFQHKFDFYKNILGKNNFKNYIARVYHKK